jgi:hypothetical protein
MTITNVTDKEIALQAELGSVTSANMRLQAENERLKAELSKEKVVAKDAWSQMRLAEEQRDALKSKVDAMGKGEPDGNALLQAIARGWCSEKNRGKEMDALLALAIRDEVQKLYGQDCAAALRSMKEKL